MSRKTKRILRTIVAKTIAITLLTIGAIVMMFPFLWALSSSLQGRGMSFVYPPKFFEPPFVWGNYVEALQELDFLTYAKNTVLITAIACAVHPFSCSFAAFGISRYDTGITRILTAIVLAMLVMPFGGNQVPSYKMWMSLGCLDTYVPILFHYFLGNVFNVYLIRQNFKSLPGDFYEAALIDGCNPIMIYLKIYLPLAKSVLAVVVLNTFMQEWNDIMVPLIYITTKSKYTLALGLLYAKSNYAERTEVLMAAAFVMMVPSIVIYAFLQKFFVQGLASAGVKG